MDWIRTHLPCLPSYSAIGTNSMTSSMSSNQPQNARPAAPISRHINVNSEQQPLRYCSNEISTCKYNILSFFPRFLIEQFRRYSNVFFLCIAILQQIPEVSPTGRYTTAVPFLLILFVSAVKEIFEDLKRRSMDIQVNNYNVQVLKGKKFETCKWKELKVGHIVKILEGHNFPADVVLLSSSEEFGMAYIETAQLDGETNLKIRQALPNTAEYSNLEKLTRINAEIECELPNRKVTEFTGTMRIGGDRVPLSITQLLLRGAKLKNCKWVYGVVIYTGHDSRLLMNSTTAPLKNSRIDIMTNRRILFLFMMLIAITVVSVIGAEIFNRILLRNAIYLAKFQTWSFLWNALTFFILYNNLIPISLQVTLEIIRFFQAGYINQDLKMYDEPNDMPANARTSNLNEELGQVQYLMTDKTGTLTRNVMKFKRCHIGRVEYGHDDKEEFDDPNLLKDMSDGKENSQLINEFLTMMASCHTAVPERTEQGEINYQATSPDEGALVRGAAINGYAFHTRKPTEIHIETPEGRKVFELLNVLEFTSDRKRMSVILRDEDGRIKLFCKGADNIIFERLSNEQNFEEHLNDTREAIDKYANKGYRTLCFAMKELDENMYEEWAAKFKDASTSLEERENKLKAVAEEIEGELLLIGITAIEDKLQENVPSTIRTLLDAGIHIWMLTGDKLETAVQIAQSSSICSKDTKLMKIAERSYDAVLEKLRNFKNESQNFLASGVEFALVIDGASLHHAVTGEARAVFAELIVDCYSVICCRMTPMQKAEIVEIVKALGGKTVLAVGDGANDVAMIQAANVGVGITGEEGLQAASASDYSIAQFQYLQRLILIHGTWNYERTVKVILYSFYKNICLYIIELWFAFFSAFSGVTIFERWTIAMFNVIFTAFPPIILGLFDRPISQRLILSNPEIYQSFQKTAFSNFRFMLWIGVSLWHSLVLFFLTYFIYGSGGILWETGRNGGWLLFGNALYTFVVATVCVKALLECDSWTFVIAVSSFGSILSWFLFLAFYSMTWHFLPLGAEMYGMFGMMVSSPVFWFSLIFVPISTLLADFVIKGIFTSLKPSPREILCQREKRKKFGCNVTNMEGQLEEVRQPSSIPLVQHYHQPQFADRHHFPINFPAENNHQNHSTTPNRTSPTFQTHQTSNEQTSIVPRPNFAENYGAMTQRRHQNGGGSNNNFETIIEEGNEVENNANTNFDVEEEEKSTKPQGNCKNSRITFTRRPDARKSTTDDIVAYRHSNYSSHNRSPHFAHNYNETPPLFSQHTNL